MSSKPTTRIKRTSWWPCKFPLEVRDCLQYESEEVIEAKNTELRIRIAELKNELKSLVIEEVRQQWESEILDHKYLEILKDRGVFYMRFCDIWRNMGIVQRVNKSQGASDYASELKSVGTYHLESYKDENGLGARNSAINYRIRGSLSNDTSAGGRSAQSFEHD